MSFDLIVIRTAYGDVRSRAVVEYVRDTTMNFVMVRLKKYGADRMHPYRTNFWRSPIEDQSRYEVVVTREGIPLSSRQARLISDRMAELGAIRIIQ